MAEIGGAGYQNPFDINGSILQNVNSAKFSVLGADVSSPVEGQEWYNGTANVKKYHDGVTAQIFASQAYVDAAVSGEDFWDRVGTVVSPNTITDSVSIGKTTVNAGTSFQIYNAGSAIAEMDADSLNGNALFLIREQGNIKGHMGWDGASGFMEIGVGNNGSTESIKQDSTGRTSVGSSPVTSAKLAVNSTTEGFMAPRMTTAQRNAITTPGDGLTIYNTESKTVQVYDTVGWGAITGGRNFASIVDTTTQNIVTPGTFQDITFNTNVVLSGFTHTASSADITCVQTGLYNILGFVHCTKTSGGSSLFEFRLVVNGTPVGTVFAQTLTTSNEVKPITGGGIISLVATDVLKIQWTSGANGQVIAPTTVGATKSASINITRFA